MELGSYGMNGVTIFHLNHGQNTFSQLAMMYRRYTRVYGNKPKLTKEIMEKKITIEYYSISKDEYVAIEDMNHEHLVNVIYKSVTNKGTYLANFRVRDNVDAIRWVRGTIKILYTSIEEEIEEDR